MGESCRHQSPASVSLTLPEEPPDSQASLQEPATALPPLPNGKIKGCPHSLYRGRAQGAEAQRRAARARFSERLARRASRGSAVGCSPRRRRGTRAERRGRSREPRTAGESRRRRCPRCSPGLVPTPEIPRLVLHAQPGQLAGRRARGSPGWGRGRRAHHRHRRRRRRCRPGLLHTPLSAPAGGEQFPCQDPGQTKKKGQNPDRLVLTVKPWGARALPLLHASAAAAGSRSALGLHREPLGSAGLLRGGSGAGQWLGRRAAGNATGGAHCSPEPPRCARRASEQRREPPRPCAAPLPARRSTTGRGDPRLQRGEPRGALRLASQPLPGAAAGGPRGSELQMDTFPPWSPARRGAARRADAAAARLLVRGQEDGASPCPGAPWYCPIRTLGEGAGENGAGLGNEGR